MALRPPLPGLYFAPVFALRLLIGIITLAAFALCVNVPQDASQRDAMTTETSGRHNAVIRLANGHTEPTA